MRRTIGYILNGAEISSGFDRLSFAERLIQQLPEKHEGRNTWLLNYGQSIEAQALRTARGISWNTVTESAETVKG